MSHYGTRRTPVDQAELRRRAAERHRNRVPDDVAARRALIAICQTYMVRDGHLQHADHPHRRLPISPGGARRAAISTGMLVHTNLLDILASELACVAAQADAAMAAVSGAAARTVAWLDVQVRAIVGWRDYLDRAVAA